jgi:hypothetical protein
MASLPMSRLYYFIEQGMHFKVTVTLRAARMEWWIRRMQWEFLDRDPVNSKCVGLDYEYTNAMKNMKKRNLPHWRRCNAPSSCNSLRHTRLLSSRFAMQMQCQSS